MQLATPIFAEFNLQIYDTKTEHTILKKGEKKKKKKKKKKTKKKEKKKKKKKKNGEGTKELGSLTLLRMVLSGAAQGWGAKTPLSLKSVIHTLQW